MSDYRAILAKSPEPGEDPRRPLERIGELGLAKSKRLSVAMNRGGSFNFTHPILADMASYIRTIKTCVILERDKQALWSGPVWSVNGDAVSGMLTVGCVGWLERLVYREIREDLTYDNLNEATGEPWYDMDIVLDVLNRVIAYEPGYAPPLVPGPCTGQKYPRQKKWSRGTKVETILRELSDIEAGFDYWVDPLTRELNLGAWDTYKDLPNVHYGYNWGPNNLANVGFSEAGDAMRNRLDVYGDETTVPALVQDAESKSEYGLMEESVNLTGVKDTPTLLYYGGAEVTVKRVPLRVYTLTPFPYVKPEHGGDSFTPRIFQDFNLRDKVRFSVDYGFLQERKRAVRVYGAEVEITDAGDEILSSLTTSYASGS